MSAQRESQSPSRALRMHLSRWHPVSIAGIEVDFIAFSWRATSSRADPAWASASSCANAIADDCDKSLAGIANFRADRFIYGRQEGAEYSRRIYFRNTCQNGILRVLLSFFFHLN